MMSLNLILSISVHACASVVFLVLVLATIPLFVHYLVCWINRALRVCDAYDVIWLLIFWPYGLYRIINKMRDSE